MKRILWALLLLWFIPWHSLAAQAVQDEGFLHTLGPEWKSFYGVNPEASYHLIQLVRHGETVKDWTEMVVLEDRVEPFKGSPEEAMNKWLKHWAKNCESTTQSKIISKDVNTVLFQMHADPCKGYPEEDDLARIILGPHSWYVVSYNAKVHEMAPEIRAQWTKTLSEATLDSVAFPFDPVWSSVDVDATVAFPSDKVAAAVKAAMTTQECQVTSEAAGKIVCKRPQIDTTTKEHRKSGAVSVVAELQPSGNQTQIHIKTDTGISARVPKRNISTPIYEDMMKTLEKGQQ
jgi:hypothetical protein